MKVTPTSIPEVLVFEPHVFGDDRGFFYESFNARQFAQTDRRTRPISSRITIRVRRRTCCAACITRSASRRENWCGSCPVRCSTWWSTSAARRRSSAAGSASSCRPKTGASCGCRPASRMASWSPATAPNACTRPPITGRPSTNARSCGTTRRWPSTGRLRASRCCRARTARAAAGRRRSLPMKILLTGASGQVGYELERSLQGLGEVIAVRPRAAWTCPTWTRCAT